MRTEQILDRFADQLKCTQQHPRRRVVFLATLPRKRSKSQFLGYEWPPFIQPARDDGVHAFAFSQPGFPQQ